MNEIQLKHLESIKMLADCIDVTTHSDSVRVDMIKLLVEEIIKLEELK